MKGRERPERLRFTWLKKGAMVYFPFVSEPCPLQLKRLGMKPELSIINVRGLEPVTISPNWTIIAQTDLSWCDSSFHSEEAKIVSQ